MIINDTNALIKTLTSKSYTLDQNYTLILSWNIKQFSNTNKWYNNQFIHIFKMIHYVFATSNKKLHYIKYKLKDILQKTNYHQVQKDCLLKSLRLKSLRLKSK